MNPSKPPPIPTGADLLRAATAALRLRQRMAQLGKPARGTLKAFFRGEWTVEPSNRAAILHAAVHALLDADYLVARELPAGHADHVEAALRDMLARWDAYAADVNADATRDDFAPGETMHVVLAGVAPLLPRIVAYWLLYADRHRKPRSLPKVGRMHGTGELLQQLERITTGFSVNGLARTAGITKSRYREWRANVRLPSEDNIERLADGFAKLGVAYPEGQPLRASEVRFELRFECAIASLLRWFGEQFPREVDYVSQFFSLAILFNAMFSTLRAYTEDDLHRFVSRGPTAEEMTILTQKSWPITLDKIRAAVVEQDAYDVTISNGDIRLLAHRKATRVAETLRDARRQRDARPGPQATWQRDALRRLSWEFRLWRAASLGRPLPAFPGDTFKFDEAAALFVCLRGALARDVNVARYLYQRAVTMAPSSPEVRRRAATFLASTGAIDDAIKELRVVLDLAANNHAARRMLARLLTDRGFYVPALRELDVLWGFGQSSPEVDALRGRCLLGLNCLEEAERVLSRAAAATSPPPAAVEDLAACLRRLGKATPARLQEKRARHLRTGGWLT